MEELGFPTYWVANAGTSEYAVTVVLCGKLVYWIFKFNKYDNAMIISQLK